MRERITKVTSFGYLLWYGGFFDADEVVSHPVYRGGDPVGGVFAPAFFVLPLLSAVHSPSGTALQQALEL